MYPIALKKYRFRLQTVLDLRSSELDLARQRVADEERKRLGIQERIAQYDQMIEQAFAEQQQRLNDPELDIAQACEFPNYIWRIKQFRFEEYTRLEKQEKILAEAREQLRQFMIRKKSMDVLKTKDQERFNQKIDKLEDDFLSELALTRYHRQLLKYTH